MTVMCLFVRPSNIIVCLTVHKFYLLAVSVNYALVCVIDVSIVQESANMWFMFLWVVSNLPEPSICGMLGLQPVSKSVGVQTG